MKPDAYAVLRAFLVKGKFVEASKAAVHRAFTVSEVELQEAEGYTLIVEHLTDWKRYAIYAVKDEGDAESRVHQAAPADPEAG